MKVMPSFRWLKKLFVTPFVLLVLCVICSDVEGRPATRQAKVLVLMVDGVRWDLVDKEDLRGFKMLAQEGVSAIDVKPVYLTHGYPQWYSLVTGRYPTRHPFLSEIVKGEIMGDWNSSYFNPDDPEASSVPEWWGESEPIWITAEKQGIPASLYWWPGCNVEILGFKATKCVPYRSVENWNTIKKDLWNALLEILEDFSSGQLGLAQVYYEAVRYFGVVKGPDSVERKKSLKDLDDILVNLKEEIRRRQLDDISIVVASGDGIPEATALKEVSLDRFSSSIKYMLNHGSSAIVLPVAGRRKELCENLINAGIVGATIYPPQGSCPDSEPPSDTIYPIIVKAGKGYFISHISDHPKSVYSDSHHHDYDPEESNETKAIFLATGPELREGYTLESLEIVDEYNLICLLLGIEPLPSNGIWSIVEDMSADAQGGEPLTNNAINVETSGQEGGRTKRSTDDDDHDDDDDDVDDDDDDDDDDDSSEEKRQKSKKQMVRKGKRKNEDEDDDDDDDDDDSEEDEKPKRKIKKPKQQHQMGSRKRQNADKRRRNEDEDEDDDDDDDSSEEDEKPKRKVQPKQQMSSRKKQNANKRQRNEDEHEDDDSSEEDEKPKRKVKKPKQQQRMGSRKKQNANKRRKNEDEDEEDSSSSSEEEEPVKPKAKKEMAKSRGNKRVKEGDKKDEVPQKPKKQQQPTGKKSLNGNKNQQACKQQKVAWDEGKSKEHFLEFVAWFRQWKQQNSNLSSFM